MQRAHAVHLQDENGGLGLWGALSRNLRNLHLEGWRTLEFDGLGLRLLKIKRHPGCEV